MLFFLQHQSGQNCGFACKGKEQKILHCDDSILGRTHHRSLSKLMAGVDGSKVTARLPCFPCNHVSAVSFRNGIDGLQRIFNGARWFCKIGLSLTYLSLAYT